MENIRINKKKLILILIANLKNICYRMYKTYHKKKLSDEQKILLQEQKQKAIDKEIKLQMQIQMQMQTQMQMQIEMQTQT